MLLKLFQSIILLLVIIILHFKFIDVLLNVSIFIISDRR